MMMIKKDKVKSGEYACLYYNHKLFIPRNTSLLHRHRGITHIQKKNILTLIESGVSRRKIMSVLSK